METEEKKKIVNLLEHFERLKNTPRTGYTYYGIKHPESVAEHNFMVVLISLILAMLRRDRGESIDVEKVLKMAVLHEIGEVLIGDLHRMTRKYIGNELVEQAEERVADDLLSLLPQGIKKDLLDAYQEFNRRESKEALLVSSADKLELLLYVYLLEKWGYDNLDAFFTHSGNRDMVEDEMAISILDEIVRRRNEKR